MKWTLGIAAAALLVGLVSGWALRPEPDPPPRSVPERVVIEKPVAVPTIQERIVYRNVPVEVTRTVTEIDTLILKEFLAAAVNPDSVPPLHLPYSGQFDGEKLLLWGTLSNGDRTFAEYDVRPKFQFGWDADSSWVREERLARFPKWRVAGGAVVVAAVAVCVFAVCK